MRGRRSRALVGLGLAGLLFAFWLFLAPTQLGGWTTYTATVGNSMEPMFHKGDLALTRKAPSYRVGEIVLYNSPIFHRPVLHRIIVIQHGHYFFKGDHNDFVDPGYVTRDRLLGKLWIHVPRAGKVFGWMGKPGHAALLAAIAVFVLFFGGGKQARRRRGRRRQSRPVGRRLPVTAASMSRHFHRPRKSAENIAGGALGLLALVLLLAGFSSPLKKHAQIAGAYRQTGTFSYSAKAIRPVATYPSGVAHAGDPIFLDDFRKLQVGFSYHFVSGLAHGVRGTISLKARVSSDTNWHRDYVLGKRTAFTGDGTSVHGTLDLAALRALVTQISVDSGAVGADYSLQLLPVVNVRGLVGHNRIDQKFAPTLPITLSQTVLKLVVSTPTTLPGASYAPPSPQAALKATLNPTQPGSVPGFVPGFVSVARYALPVSTARGLALGLAALAFLIFCSKPMRRRRREVWSLERRLANRFECVIVDVVSIASGSATRGVETEIPDFESLATLARYCERPILRETSNGRQAYAVEDGGRLYVYRAAPTPAPSAIEHAEPPAPLKREPVVVAPGEPKRSNRRRLLRPTGLVVFAILAVTVATAMTGANTVPASYAGASSQARQIAQLTPSQCSAVGATNLIVVTGTTTAGTGAADLIIGPSTAATITLTGGGGNDCIVGGGGAGTTNKFDGGAGTGDVCIGAPGATNTFKNCEATY